MSDQYEQIRSLPFPALAAALGLDIGQYRQRKHGQEFYGPCPVHNPKQNSTSFSYAADGRFNCFSCNAKGRGAIDLVKLVRGVGFQAAVELLGAVPIIEPSNAKSPATGQNESVKVRTFGQAPLKRVFLVESPFCVMKFASCRRSSAFAVWMESCH